MTQLSRDWPNDQLSLANITDDWLKLTDFDPENVIKLGPVRERKEESLGRGII